MIPDVRIGKDLREPVDWRTLPDLDEDPDDEELAETPADVVRVLGFDPLSASLTEDSVEPTLSQIEAGNYRKEHLSWCGLQISVENGQGSVRRGRDWDQRLHHPYGYIRRTEGADGDHVDVFLGPDLDSPWVYVINQWVGGRFDEHKVVIGASSRQEARGIYLANYPQGWTGYGGAVEMPVDEFKAWLRSGDTKRHLTTDDRWITIKGKGSEGEEEEGKGYRRVLLGPGGKVKGGDLPKETHGKKLGEAERELPGNKPEKSKNPFEGFDLEKDISTFNGLVGVYGENGEIATIQEMHPELSSEQAAVYLEKLKTHEEELRVKREAERKAATKLPPNATREQIEKTLAACRLGGTYGTPVTTKFKSQQEADDALRNIAQVHSDIYNNFETVQKVMDAISVHSGIEIVNGGTVKGCQFGYTGESDLNVVGGFYHHQYKKIVISRDSWKWDTPKSVGIGGGNIDYSPQGIFRHELGHHIYDNLNTATGMREFRSAFVDAVRSMKPEDIKKGISFYAVSRTTRGEINFHETFAESFSAWTHPQYGTPGRNRKLPIQIARVFEKHMPKKKGEPQNAGT